jgi:ATP-dependent DNA helicase RecQ
MLEAAEEKRTWWTLDLATTASQINEPTDRIRRALNHLAELGDLRLQPSGLRHAYRLNPDCSQDVATATEEMKRLFSNRESGEIDRLNQVIAFCQSTDCLTQHLLDYFGEHLAEPCGACSNCLSPPAAPSPLPCSLNNSLSLDQVDLMRSVVAEKHIALRQPRQLTRFLCGITSPAASRARLSRHDHFGALAEVPFQEVLTQANSMVLA